MKLQLIHAIASIAVLSTPIAAVGMADTSGIPWTYRELDALALSPPQWGEGYPTCYGTSQSPIDIVTTDKDSNDYSDGRKADDDDKDSEDHDSSDDRKLKSAPLRFSGDCSSLTLKANIDAYKWGATATSTCKVHRGTDSFSLIQYHAHIGSEHRINGEQEDAEIHFVHQLDGGSDLLVIGLMLDGSDDAYIASNPWMDAVWSNLSHINETVTIESSYADVLTAQMGASRVFNYAGSLTTPPCSEIVDWWVIGTPIQVSETQLSNLLTLTAQLEATDNGKAARPVQPLNDRAVKAY